MVRELELVPPGKRSALRAPFAALAAALADTSADPLLPARPDLRLERGADPPCRDPGGRVLGRPRGLQRRRALVRAAYTSPDPFMRYLLPGQRGLAGALWGRGIRLLNRHRGLRLELDRKMPGSPHVGQRGPARHRGGAPSTITPARRTGDLPRAGRPGPPARPPAPATPRTRPRSRSLADSRSRRAPASPTALPRPSETATASTRSSSSRASPRRRSCSCSTGWRGSSASRIALSCSAKSTRAAWDRCSPAPSATARAVHLAGAVRPPCWLEGALARVPVVGSRSGGMPEDPSRRTRTPSSSRLATQRPAQTRSPASSPTLKRDPRPAPPAPSSTPQKLSFDNYMAQVDDFIRAAVAAPHRGAAHQDGEARRHLRRPVGSPSSRSKSTS